MGAEILFPVRSRAPGFHACSKTGSRVARLSSSRPRLPRKTSSFPELRPERKIKRIPSGACLHPSRDFRAARVLAERLTFAFSEWSTAGSQGIARRSTKCRRPSHRANATNQSFGFPSLFDDFLTGQITPSVLSRSGQTLRIETSREKKKVLPSNCLENVWTNVSIERKF